MKKESLEVSGYTVLPLRLPETRSFKEPAIHYLYIRPHEPRIPDPDSARCLFVVNLPIDTTELHLRHLFGSQLSAGRVVEVEFEDVPTKKHKHGSAAAAAAAQGNVMKRSKKRKIVTADELQSQLESIELPSTWNRRLQKSGAHAVVVFVDKASKEASLKAVNKAGNKGTQIIWGEGIEDRIPALGVERYTAHEQLQYPDRAELLRTVNDYMTVFGNVADARAQEESRKAQEPDEDGFVTVTHGPKFNDVSREDELKELLEKQEKKDSGLEDFYRFQTREKRKEKQNELLRKFGEDKKKLEEVKKRRGRIRVSGIKLGPSIDIELQLIDDFLQLE